MAPRPGTSLQRLLAVGAVLGVLGALPAEAVPVIRFDQAADGGTLLYSAVGGTLRGVDIAFDFITATETPLNAGLITCIGCLLNFETGVNTTNGPGAYTWAGGGFFEIRGSVPAAGIVDDLLVSGVFTEVSGFGLILPGRDQLFVGGFGLDNKHPALLAFFGLANLDFRFASTNISALASVAASGTFTGGVTEADVTNTAVPEPGSTVLLLLGLGSLAAYRRRSR